MRSISRLRLSDPRHFCPLVTPRTPPAADWPEFRGPTGNGHVAAPGDSAARRPAAHVERIGKRPLEDADPAPRLVHARRHGRPDLAHHRHRRRPRLLRHLRRRRNRQNPPQQKAVPQRQARAARQQRQLLRRRSPAIEPGRVYVHFGSFGTACLDTSTGKIIWKRDDLPCRHYRGPSSSVVLFENLVILTLDGADLQYVVALDKKTGKTVWKTDRDVEWNDENITGEYAKYAAHRQRRRLPQSPQHAAHRQLPDGKPLLLSGGAKATFAYDPRTGKELWRVHYDDWSVAPRPLYQDGIAYIVTGLMHPELWAINTDGTGDVTDIATSSGDSKPASPKPPRPLLVDGLIYMVNDDGVASCVDAANGDVVWKKRIGGQLRRLAHLRRRPHLLLRPGRRNHRHQTRPQIRRARHQHARRRLHGLPRRRRRRALPPHQVAISTASKTPPNRLPPPHLSFCICHFAFCNHLTFYAQRFPLLQPADSLDSEVAWIAT